MKFSNKMKVNYELQNDKLKHRQTFTGCSFVYVVAAFGVGLLRRGLFFVCCLYCSYIRFARHRHNFNVV